MVNSKIYHTNTKQHANCHQPSMNLAEYQKGVTVWVFNVLPSYIKIV